MSTIQMTILGQTFEITAPYAEGYVLNGAEAATLNQTRKENISNSVRKSVAEALSEDGSITPEALAGLVAAIAEYDAEYTFSGRRGPSTRMVLDPIEKEARAIARDKLVTAIQAKGLKVKDYDKELFETKLTEIAARENIMAEAKRRVNARGKLDLDTIEA